MAQLNSIRTGVVCCVHSSLRVLLNRIHDSVSSEKIMSPTLPPLGGFWPNAPRSGVVARAQVELEFQRLRPKVAAATTSRTTSERGPLPNDGLEPSAVVAGDIRRVLGMNVSNVFKRVSFGVCADRPAFGGRMSGGEGLATPSFARLWICHLF